MFIYFLHHVKNYNTYKLDNYNAFKIDNKLRLYILVKICLLQCFLVVIKGYMSATPIRFNQKYTLYFVHIPLYKLLEFKKKSIVNFMWNISILNIHHYITFIVMVIYMKRFVTQCIVFVLYVNSFFHVTEIE